MDFLKIVLAASIIFLLADSQKKTRIMFIHFLLFLPFIWMYLFKDNIGIGIAKYIARILPVCVLFFLSEKEKYYFSLVYVKVFIFSLFPGLILQLMLLSGIDIPYTLFQHPTQEKKFFKNYYGVNFQSLVSTIRFGAIYDEPGVVGTLGGLIIFFFFRVLNRFYKTVLIISILVSFSLYGILVLIFSLLWHMFRSMKPKYIIAYLSLFVILIGFALNYISTFAGSDDLVKQSIYRGTFSRLGFESKEGVEWSGINLDRNGAFEIAKEEYRKDVRELNLRFFFGQYLTHGRKERQPFDVLNLDKFIHYYGLIFMLYFFLFFVVLIPKKRFYFLLGALFVLITCLYQRPLLFRMEYMLIFLGGYSLERLVYKPKKIAKEE